jgi:TP901 family phage tail tape measure protein
LGNTAPLEAALKRVGTQMNGVQNLGKGMESVGRSMTRNITAPILAIGVASADAAMKFQASTERLRTQAGATQGQVDALRKGMLSMAGAVGSTPEQLSSGMYHVVSSMNAVLPPTHRVSSELTLLKYSAELAKVGGSDLEETSYALASAMNALHAPISQAGKVTGELNAIVGAGDMTMTDLIESFKSGLIPTARIAGLSLQSLGSALAVMGDMGMRGSLAGTRLRMSIALLSSPSKQAANILDTLGLSAKQATSTSQAMSAALSAAGLRTVQLGADLKRPDGFMVALKDLNDHLRSSGLTATGAAAVMNKAFGGGRMGATISLLAENTGRLSLKFDQIGKSSANFGADWTATTQTAQFKLHAALATMQADAVNFGATVLPILLNVGHVVVTDVDKVAHAFTSLPKGAQDAIIKGGLLLAGIGPALKLLGVFTGGVGKLWQISERMQSWGMASSLAGNSTGPAAARLSSVATMNVGTLIAKSTVSGLGGSAGTEYRTLGSSTAPYVSGPAPVVAPSAVPAAASAGVETSMVSAGLLSSVKSGLGKALGGGLQGLMIAGIGTTVSQALGAAIHGSVGKAISSIGTDASIGAGLGRVFGPAGMIPGALAGALVGGITDFINQDAEAQGKAFADKFLAPLPGALSNKALDRLKKDAGATGPPAANTAAGARFQTLAQHADLWNSRFNFGYSFGKTVGADFVTTMQGVTHQTQAALTASIAKTLSTVPANVRASGAPAVQAWQDEAATEMLAYATSLQVHGKLPHGAVDSIIFAMEQRFAGLHTFLLSTGRDNEKAIAKGLDLSAATGHLTDSLKAFEDYYNRKLQLGKLSNTNLLADDQKAQADLTWLIANGAKDQRAAYIKELDLMRKQAADVWRLMGGDAAKGLARVASVATSGLSGISSLFSAAAPHRKGHAQGGLVQIGRNGEKGIDSVPLDVSGTPILVAPGEQVAILTHDQQTFLNDRLDDVGGLSGMFSSLTTPHYMATGGMVRSFATGGMVWGVNPTTGKRVKHSSEEWAKIMATYKRDHSGGGTYYGTNPTTGQRVKHSKEEWAKIWATYYRDHAAGVTSSTTGAALTPAQKAAAAEAAKLAAIPSQATGAQISMTQLANSLQVATNANNTGGQQKDLTAELALERSWLSNDTSKLAQINKALANHPSATLRGTLDKDKLAILQEIGTIEGNIGSAMSSLTNLTGTSGTGTSASTSQFDLTPGGSAVTLPTAFDVSRAVGGRPGLEAARDRATPSRSLHGQTAGKAVVVNSAISIHPTNATDARVIKSIAEHALREMEDKIERGVKGHLHAQTRRAGLRGT